jgi:hypothetical protein
MSTDAIENVVQIGERIDAESFTCGDNAGQHRRCPSAIIASQKHPILPANLDSTQAARSPLLSIAKSPSSQYRVNAFQFDNV